jgi:hypothetical protein
LEGLAGRVEEIAKKSLEVKSSLRGEERNELILFRVALEKWEDFLQSALFDFAMAAPSEAEVNSLREKDRQFFLDVKIAVVRACTYLRDKELEQRLMQSVLSIRKLYYPINNDTLPRLINLQAQLIPLEAKLSAFQKSDMTNMAFAPTEHDRDEHLKLQKLITDELKKSQDDLVARYRPVAEHMAELKEAVNQYIYRPIRRSAIDKE